MNKIFRIKKVSLWRRILSFIKNYPLFFAFWMLIKICFTCEIFNSIKTPFWVIMDMLFWILYVSLLFHFTNRYIYLVEVENDYIVFYFRNKKIRIKKNIFRIGFCYPSRGFPVSSFSIGEKSNGYQFYQLFTQYFICEWAETQCRKKFIEFLYFNDLIDKIQFDDIINLDSKKYLSSENNSIRSILDKIIHGTKI